MDILSVIYRNYKLLDLQRQHWQTLSGDHRLLLCDNTPEAEYQSHSDIYRMETLGSDGETHGRALDFLIQQSTSDIIGIVDSDFFWLNPNIISHVEQLFQQGVKCYGCAGYYRDWQRVIDVEQPAHKGDLAPVCWGMFVTRELALQHTFVCTSYEGSQKMYTGWRLRKHLIENNIPRITLPGYEDSEDFNICYFGEQDKPQGVHFLKGSSWRIGETNKLPNILQKGSSLWNKN